MQTPKRVNKLKMLQHL